MKKIIALLTVLLMLTTLCSCAKSKNKEPESEFSSESASAEQAQDTTAPQKKGMIFAKSTDGETMTANFSFNGQEYSPEIIAAGLTGFTGYKFRISSDVDEASKTIRIQWLSDSAYVTGERFNENNQSFAYKNKTELQKFMKESLVNSIKDNMGNYKVEFDETVKEVATSAAKTTAAETTTKK